jgi:hypothetical protein
MVGLLKALLPPLLLATFAAAQSNSGFNITQPSSSIWWVAKSQNVLSWNCNSNLAAPNFTILINNVNQNVLVGPLAFLSIEYNVDCSITVSQDKVNQPAATGYYIIFANDFNNSDVYTISDQFEIKPLGSSYASQVTSSVSSGSSGTAAESSSPSASSSAFDSHSPSFFGLTGIMGLLTVGLLGA